MSAGTAEHTTAGGRPGLARRVLRALRLRPVSLAVLAIGVGATMGAFVLARDWVDQKERSALAREATRAATAIQSQAAASRAAFDVASAIAEATNGGPQGFERLMGARLHDPSIASVSLLRVRDGTVTRVASAGTPPILVDRLSEDERARIAEVAEGAALAPIALENVGGDRVAVLAARATADGRYATAIELRYPPTLLREPVVRDNVDYALYAGTTISPLTLFGATTTRLPLHGPTVTAPVEVLGATGTIVVAARGALVGGIRGELEWIVLLAGLVLTGVAVVAIEASRRREETLERQRRLEAENERLRQLDGQKDEFISLISHDLRTPLTSIIGYTELLLDEDGEVTGEEQRRFVEIIQRNGRRLLGMVEDLLFMARLQAGRLQLDLDEVDLAEAAGQCVEAVRPRADARGISLRLERETAIVHGDERRLCQLVDNLVSNALKFTPAGGTVTVRVEDAGDSAVLEVADTGIGIPAGEVDRLFDRFYRASSATERELPGTGLGLTIAKAIVDAHHGTISVTSVEGGGTTFRCELPARPLGRDEAAAAATARRA